MSMTVHELTQLVCGELPEGYELEISLENGAGSVRLHLPDTDAYIEEDGRDLTFEEQIVELVKYAKGEPSSFDDLREGPTT